MQVTIVLGKDLVKDMLMLQRVEEGKEGNYTRVESIVDPLRYKISDRIMTLVMHEIDADMGKRPTLHTYDRK